MKLILHQPVVQLLVGGISNAVLLLLVLMRNALIILGAGCWVYLDESNCFLFQRKSCDEIIQQGRGENKLLANNSYSKIILGPMIVSSPQSDYYGVKFINFLKLQYCVGRRQGGIPTLKNVVCGGEGIKQRDAVSFLLLVLLLKLLLLALWHWKFIIIIIYIYIIDSGFLFSSSSSFFN